jgi:hypothetical protein
MFRTIPAKRGRVERRTGNEPSEAEGERVIRSQGFALLAARRAGN